MKVLALTKYGDIAASTRQRFLQYGPRLADAGIDLVYSPLLDNDYLEDSLVGRRPPKSTIIRGYARRIRAVLGTVDADIIWLHCEFFPYWPAFAERTAARVIQKPIVFDFDDAIFHMYDDNAAWLTRHLVGNKLAPLLKRVAACSCGNAYLRDYAAQYCGRSVILPTVVDTNKYIPLQKAPEGQLTIGWIGSPSTWLGVRAFLPVIQEVIERCEARFLVVGAGRAAMSDRFPGMELREWRETSEISDIQEMDIGIMPLLDEPFQRGKSGYKLIQYMACGLPVVASPVGVNSEIVIDGVNGFLARERREWRSSLVRLIENDELRKRLGAAGRARVEEGYSLAVQAPRLIELLKSSVSC